MTGRFVQKNDFSSDNTGGGAIRNELYERINDDDETDQQDDSLEENLTRPLLDGNAHDCETDDDEVVHFTVKSAILGALTPIDLSEWNESNLFFKLMLIIKSPVNLILKLTIPLVDYEVRNHNWNKATMIINCLIAPLFMVFAIKSIRSFTNQFIIIYIKLKFSFFSIELVGNNLISNKVPVWSLALVFGVLLAVLVVFLTDMNKKPKYHWVC